MADAVRGADALSTISPDAGKVRLGATRDDSIAVSVDVSRFHDSAALAVAAALHLAVPKRRGRPRKKPAAEFAAAAHDRAPDLEAPARLQRALDSLRDRDDGDPGADPAALLAELSDRRCEFVIVGRVAELFHGRGRKAAVLELVTSYSGSRAGTLAEALNALGARPRGVSTRDGFSFDSGLIRSTGTLVVRARGVPLVISQSVPAVGEFDQIRDPAIRVDLNGRSVAVLRAD